MSFQGCFNSGIVNCLSILTLPHYVCYFTSQFRLPLITVFLLQRSESVFNNHFTKLITKVLIFVTIPQNFCCQGFTILLGCCVCRRILNSSICGFFTHSHMVWECPTCPFSFKMTDGFASATFNVIPIDRV